MREESQTHIAKSLSNASTLDDAGSEYEEDDDDDEDEVKVIAKPFHFQTPYPKFLSNADREANSIGSKKKLCHIFDNVPIEIVDDEQAAPEKTFLTGNGDVRSFVRLGNGRLMLT